jgi:hypothetical protein
MAYNLLGSACDVLGIKDSRRAERSAHLADDARPAGTMANRWRCGVVRCGPRTRSGASLANRSEPLEVVIDPIDDRDPIEANSL